MSESAASDVTVVLPCLDEAGALPGVLAAVPAHWRVVVVDNGSTDGSARVARGLGARVVHEPRRGYGAAVHAGLIAADTELIAVLDCDGSIDPAVLVGLAALVRDDRTDLACGRRQPVEAGAWPWHARLGNAVLAMIVRRSTGLAVHDIAPVRVARRTALLELGLVDRRFGYPLELLIAVSRRRWRVIEVEIDYRCRAAGTRSKVTGSVRGTARAVADFVRVLRASRKELTA